MSAYVSPNAPRNEFDMKYIKLNECSVGTEFEGWLGGVVMSKFDQAQVLLFSRQGKGWLCNVLPYSASLRKKLNTDADYVKIKYLGKSKVGQYNAHGFDIVEAKAPEKLHSDVLNHLRSHTAKCDSSKATTATQNMHASLTEGLV